MYLMPKTQKELASMLETERFKGRHDVIMSSKEYIYNQGKVDIEDYMDFIRFNTKHGWKEWS